MMKRSALPGLKKTRSRLAETAMYRFKTLLGDRLQSRKFENQWAEVLTKWKPQEHAPSLCNKASKNY